MVEEYQVDGFDCVRSDILDLVSSRIGMWITWYVLALCDLMFRMV